MEALRVSVESNLRSVVQSCKEGVPLLNLSGDYATLVGKQIPFKELGFQNLKSMLVAMPDVVRIQLNRQGPDVVFAVADKNTAHIQSLISRQRTAKSKSRMPRKTRRQFTRPGTWRPPQSSSHPCSGYVKSARFTPNRKSDDFLFMSGPRTPQQSKPAYRSHDNRSYVPAPRFMKQQAASRPPSEPLLPLPAPPASAKSTGAAQFVSYTPANTFPQSEPVLRKTIAFNASGFDRPPLYQPFWQDPARKVTVEPLPESVKNPWYKRPQQLSVQIPAQADDLGSGDQKETVTPIVSPTNSSLPSPTAISKAETNRQLVDEYATFHDYQSEYRTLQIRTKKMRIAFISTLVLNNTKYLSYPDEKLSAEEAEELAASRAVDALKISPGQYASNARETSVRTPDQVINFVERLYRIIKGKPNGIWHTSVPAYYEDKYKETLPNNWLQLLKDNCQDVTIDETLQRNCILYPESTKKSDSRVRPPDELVLPDGNYWDVYVTHISDTMAVTFRLVDYGDQYEELANAMDEHYSKNSHMATDARNGNVYALKSENSWFRVRLTELIDDTHAKCYFLDNGDTETCLINELNVMQQPFMVLPYQAKQCTLHGLESYSDCGQVYQKLFELALGKILVAEIVSRNNPLSVTLFDTSTDDDVNINDMLMEAVIESMTPRLPESGKICEGYLSHATAEGDIYLQLIGPNLTTFTDLTTDIKDLCEDRKGRVTTASQSKMYCARYDNGKWYRAFISSVVQNNMVKVLYVDYGNTDDVPLTDLCEAEAISDMLAGFPFQAVRCRLHNLSSIARCWSDEATALLYGLVPEEESLLIKVVKPGTATSLPEIDLFKRVGPLRELVSINDTILRNASLFESRDTFQLSNFARTVPDVVPHFEERSKTNVGSFGEDFPPLQSPTIPEVCEVFDVNVTLAAHPNNFTVQPWKSGTELDELMEEMQSFYNSEENICDMDVCLLKEGEFYASKHSDNRWYRTRIVKILPDQTVWVYFVDFGDYNMMTLNDMQCLWRQFRSLPYQAIKASLADVVPCDGDWSPMDSVYFQELVVDKQFASFIRRKSVEESNGLSGYKLSLMLIDTSSTEDVYIHDLLVSERKAKLTKRL